ncbi:MAG: hypothetical protein Q8J90_08530, partial [Gallionella sp.]|nr:hypothetical protein [Gallionella sp.]
MADRLNPNSSLNPNNPGCRSSIYRAIVDKNRAINCVPTRGLCFNELSGLKPNSLLPLTGDVLTLFRSNDQSGLNPWLALFFLLVFYASPAFAEELPDPTRPPASLTAPVAAPASGVPEIRPARLQSILISKTRRAAIIDGESVELGGKYGDAKLIEVNEGSIVLRGAQGRQVMTLFPDVKITGKQGI